MFIAEPDNLMHHLDLEVLFFAAERSREMENVELPPKTGIRVGFLQGMILFCLDVADAHLKVASFPYLDSDEKGPRVPCKYDEEGAKVSWVTHMPKHDNPEEIEKRFFDTAQQAVDDVFLRLAPEILEQNEQVMYIAQRYRKN